jgi:hypothetical protein
MQKGVRARELIKADKVVYQDFSLNEIDEEKIVRSSYSHSI